MLRLPQLRIISYPSNGDFILMFSRFSSAHPDRYRIISRQYVSATSLLFQIHHHKRLLWRQSITDNSINRMVNFSCSSLSVVRRLFYEVVRTTGWEPLQDHSKSVLLVLFTTLQH